MHHPSNIPLYSQSFIDSSIPDRDPQVKKGNKNVLQEIPITNRNMEFFKRSQNPLFLKSDEFSKDILRKIAADKVKRNLNNDYKNKLVKPKNDVKNLEEKINQKLELKNTNFLEEYLDKLSLNESKPNFVPYRELENQNLKNTYSNDIIENLKSIELKHEYKNFLENHKIPPHLRAKMVDWMVEVLCSYKCQDQTFFLSISIMDWFFKKSKK